MLNKSLKFILLISLIFMSCKKENGRHEYVLQLIYDNGTINSFKCKIYEKYRKNKKYNEQFSNKFNAKVNDGKAIYLTYGGYIFLKINNKLICSEQIFTYNYINDVYFEGEYTQKGNRYTVENGYFEEIKRDLGGNPLDTVFQKGRWSLQRK